jgi:hypothetical protein
MLYVLGVYPYAPRRRVEDEHFFLYPEVTTLIPYAALHHLISPSLYIL